MNIPDVVTMNHEKLADAIVTNIRDLTHTLALKPLARPWLPPLAERIVLSDLQEGDFKKDWTVGHKDLVVTVGQADLPSKQAQETAKINLTQDGHLMLYGAPGTAKTTFLQSATLSLARKHSPADLTVYLIDLGTNGLAPLSSLPHVADLIRLDQEEKLSKFTRIMDAELTRRKKLLAEYGVGNFAMYQRASGQSEPEIVLVLDSFESMKDESFENDLFKLLLRISREGLSVGVHLMMTAGRQSNLRATFYSNIKHQLSLKQNDISEVKNAVGRSDFADLPDIKGRALMKRDTIDVVQFALPTEGDNENAIVDAIRAEGKEMSATWQGEHPTQIPMVPDDLYPTTFYQMPTVVTALLAKRIPLGLDLETVEAVSWEVNKGNLLYLTDKDSQMQVMAEQIVRVSESLETGVAIFAPEQHMLPDLSGVTIYSEPKKVKDMLAAFGVRMEERFEERKTTHVVTLVFYDYAHFVSELDTESKAILAKLFEQGYKVGYASLVLTDRALSSQIDMASKQVKLFKQALLGMRVADQNILSVTNRPIKEGALGNQVQYIIQNGYQRKVKTVIE